MLVQIARLKEHHKPWGPGTEPSLIIATCLSSSSRKSRDDLVASPVKHAGTRIQDVHVLYQTEISFSHIPHMMTLVKPVIPLSLDENYSTDREWLVFDLNESLKSEPTTKATI